MQALAKGILDQRSETELFFMEALSEVSTFISTLFIGLCGFCR